MKNRFLKNVSFMSAGTLFKFFLAFISTAVYIRIIGTSGYAVLGIVLSLFGILNRFDIPHYLSLVKYKAGNSNNYQKIYHTLFNSILITDLIFIFVALPLTYYLSASVYEIQGLWIMYIIALVVFIFDRLSSFITDFVRSNRHESLIQRSIVPSITLEFIIALVLLFSTNLGVMAIFIGKLAGSFVKLAIIFYYADSKFIKYKASFSFKLFMTALKQYSFQHYLSKILTGIIIWGGLFISTFFLETKPLGILTIFISVVLMLREFSYSFIDHIIPIYAYFIKKKNKIKLQQIINHAHNLLLVGFFFSIIFVLTIGRKLFTIYFGQEMQGTYFLFLLLITSALVWICFLPWQYLVFVYSIRIHTFAFCIVSLLFVSLLLPIIWAPHLNIVVIAYMAAYLAIPVIFLYISSRIFKIKISKESTINSFIALLFMLAVSFLGRTSFSFVTGSIIFVLLAAVLLLLYYKKIRNIFRFLASEMES